MAAIFEPDEAEAIAEQRAELMMAKTLESDLDFAYSLQLEEAMAASLSLLPSSSSSSSSSSSPPKPPRISCINGVEAFNFADAQSKELEKLEQEKRDRELCEKEARKLRVDLYRRIHDQKVAIDIVRMNDDDWDDFGDEFERPFGEGSSSSNSSGDNVNFRLYFKGLVSVERVGDSEVALTGIGVAICDPKDNLIFQLSKPLLGNGISRQVTEIKALIEGLETAIALDFKRITFFCDYPTVYQYARQVWKPKGRKVAMLMEKVKLLRKRFTYCHPSLVARFNMKFAFKLARDAIVSQKSKPAESNHVRIIKETCVICLEETDQDKMFTVDGCLHKYCFSCMKQHVEAKLYCGMIPKCPHESCKSELNAISCEKFLTPKVMEILKQRINEASIPVTLKLYCPYPRCSALMSKSEIFSYTEKENVRERNLGARKCMKCHGLFCINCKGPWHKNMTCAEYRRSNPPEDLKLKSLATRNFWRQCVKCNHMIELAQGCYHMTCRCGYQFCYTCGAEWKNKKATCSCPLWDEENILLEDTDFDEEDDDDYDDDDDDYSDSDSDWY